jgi:hypothetical protein
VCHKFNWLSRQLATASQSHFDRSHNIDSATHKSRNVKKGMTTGLGHGEFDLELQHISPLKVSVFW